MNVSEVMTSFPDTLDAEASIREAARLMRDGDYGVVPIIDINGSLIGIVTDRDIVVKAVAGGSDIDAPVRQCMTQQPDTVGADTTMEDAMRLMAKRQVRRLPVLENGRLIGMVSFGDIATSPESDHKKADTLAELSVNEETQRTTSSLSGEEGAGGVMLCARDYKRRIVDKGLKSLAGLRQPLIVQGTADAIEQSACA